MAKKKARKAVKAQPRTVIVGPADNKNGIVSLVLGICSILLPIIGLILGVLALIFYAKQRKIQPSGMATAGLITGIVGICFSIGILLYILVALIFIATVASTTVGAAVLP
jgi:hypothetical protein